MKFYSYIMDRDRGIAPNPFWDYCTLAMCTPNYRGIKADRGDWIVGFSSADNGNKLIYAMEVSERLHFDKYFNDERFAKKKPILNGSWKQRCGDNIYSFNEEGDLKPIPSLHRDDKEIIRKDIHNPYVFISENFYYFGEKAIIIPDEFLDLIYRKRGIKCSFDQATVEGFLIWLQKNHTPGIHGNPAQIDIKTGSEC